MIYYYLFAFFFGGGGAFESKSKPGNMVDPQNRSRMKKAATVSGWDGPLPTLIYRGFDCGSDEQAGLAS